MPQLHKPELKKEEQEILDFYKDWQHHCNHEFHKDIDAGKAFYDLSEAVHHDFVENAVRGKFNDHYDRTAQLLGNALTTQLEYKDLEITAITQEFGYATTFQRYSGKTKDGLDFDFKYRMIGLVTKTNGKWKWIYEHISFPVDLTTGIADLQGGIDEKEAP